MIGLVDHPLILVILVAVGLLAFVAYAPMILLVLVAAFLVAFFLGIPLILLVLVAAVLLAFTGGAQLWRHTVGRQGRIRNRNRYLRWRIWLRMRPGPGWASHLELIWRWSRMRAVLTGARARPGLPWWHRLVTSATGYAVRLGRAQWFRRVWGRMEDQTLVLAPPRAGKSGYLSDRMLDHPGPVVTTSTRPDTLKLTGVLRARRGPLEVFNPQGVGGPEAASTLCCDLIRGCEDPQLAMMLAQALTGGVHRGGGEGGDMAWWRGKAEDALAALLHAAALVDAGIEDVFAWTNRLGDDQVPAVLARDPRAAKVWIGAVAEIRRQGKTADSIRMTMSRALSWVALPGLRDAVTPRPGVRVFDPAAFALSTGTLYMIAAEAGETSPVAPLFRALAERVVWEGTLAGSPLPSGKLDPPLMLALDEVTQICPVPLPQWLADSAGRGIVIVAVAHGIAQLEDRWGKAGAQAIWDTAGCKILLGGLSDADTLESVSQLCGEIELRRPGQEGRGLDRYTRVRVVPPELVRMLPDWRALVLRTNRPPLSVKLRMAWWRRDVRRVVTWRPQPIPDSLEQPLAVPDELAARRTAAAPLPAPPGEDPAAPLPPSGPVHPPLWTPRNPRQSQ